MKTSVLSLGQGAIAVPTKRDAQVAQQFDFLLQAFTPRTVFMDIGSADCALSLRAATYVERVWCVESATGRFGASGRPLCNLRHGAMGDVPLQSIHVAFSQTLRSAHDVWRLLAPDGVYFVYGRFIPLETLREAGFSRVQYYAGSLRIPAVLARACRSSVTAAYK
jgi:hypothetical protein